MTEIEEAAWHANEVGLTIQMLCNPMNETYFLNIDLDVESKCELDILVNEVKDRFTVMAQFERDGLYCASFETGESGIESIVEEFVDVIDKLSKEARLQWNNAEKKEFNIGFQGGFKPNGYSTVLPQNVLNLVVSVGGSVGITIYPPTVT